MAASRVSSTISHAGNLLNNAVHIKIHPQPNSLSESRAILRELQKFGEVAMFRNLRWDHSPNKPLDTALAIYSTRDAKTKLLAQSPVQFTPSAEEGEEHFDLLDSQNFTPFGRPPAPSPSSSSPPQPSAPRTFSLDIRTSSFDHEAHIKRQPYYAGFNPDMRTLVAQELRTKVPLLGLADWGRNKETPNRIVQRRKSVGGIREMARDGMRREMGRDKKWEWEDGSNADVEGSKEEVC